MSKEATQFYLISPEELRRDIIKDMRKELQELSKNFRPKEPVLWITRKEASELIGVSLVTIHNWSKEGIINPYKIGNRVRFKRTDIENILLNSNKKASK